MPAKALDLSRLVHPDIFEPLVVDLRGDRPGRPYRGGRPPSSWKPHNHKVIALEGFELIDISGPQFEFDFETKGHLIDFNFGESPSLMRVNGGEQKIWSFQPYTTSFAPVGTTLYRKVLEHDDKGSDHRLIALSIAPAYLNLLACDILDGRELGFVDMSPPERWVRLDRIQSGLLALFQVPHMYSRLTAEALANDAIMRAMLRWSSLGNRLAPTRFQTDDDVVRRAISFIHDNLTRNISLADIARAAERDATILVHVFKLATGRTPYAYLLDCRVAAAKQDLRNTDLSVASIARRYSFGSPSHFSTAFRKSTGASPTAYRRNT